MDSISHLIFVFLFFITSIGSMIGSKVPPDGKSLIEARDRGRSTGFVTVEADSGMGDPNVLLHETPPGDQSLDPDKKYFPCESLSITTSGAVCDDYELDFPEVNLKDVLYGDIYLPRTSTTVFISKKFIRSAVYRNITLVFCWDPATPEFLQIHLEEYLPYWENRIPYRLFWEAEYEVCYDWCTGHTDTGEFLPEDIEGLPSSLAADINFNGVPAAFWNENISP